MNSKPTRMGLASRPGSSPPRIDPGGVGIIETIEVKGTPPSAHAPGLVLVLDAYPLSEPGGFVGRAVRIRIPSGRTLPARIEEVRDHGATISLFFRDLSRNDVPEGSRIEFDD